MGLILPNRRDRALMAMEYFEKRERTSSEWYKLAQRISIKEVFSQEFNVAGCQTGRMR